jgi:hypothetical protein
VLPARKVGIVALLDCAALSLCTAGAQQNHLQDNNALCAAMLDALRAALEADARGLLDLPQQQRDAAAMTSDMERAAHASAATRSGLQEMLRRALGDPAHGATSRIDELRARHGLTAAEEAALRALLRRVDASMEPTTTTDDDDQDVVAAASMYMTSMRRRGDADVARHGLRTCGLPDCGATEPHPKAFKVCSRCRGVVYCSAAHQQQDWRRHKREDGCKAGA